MTEREAREELEEAAIEYSDAVVKRLRHRNFEEPKKALTRLTVAAHIFKAKLEERL